MGKQFTSIEPAHRAFIGRQRIFFTASAADGTLVNVSPRSTDALRVLDANTVAYLDLTGSGNETSAHIKAGGRVTIMFAAFEGPPMILRLFGRGEILPSKSAPFEALLGNAFGGTAPRGTRQILSLSVEMVQTSCGFAVPLFDYKAERENLARWTAAKDDAALDDYRREKNVTSLDGLPTGMFDTQS
jgi:Pyridoxamine 5'-phosphate oxidase